MSEELVAKYKKRLEQELELKATTPSSQLFSQEYDIFRKEILPPHMSLYESVCNSCEKVLKLKANPEVAAKIQGEIDSCHLQISPGGVLATSYLLPLAFLLISTFLFILMPTLVDAFLPTGQQPGAFASFLLGFESLFFASFAFIVGIAAIFVLQKIPQVLANTWRLKSSNQMVLCIFYVVTYMRHTSNLELAIEFASEHLSPPLSLDLRKIMWDVESNRFDTIKDSLETYLNGWREYNLEFVEAFHLVESSLYETSEERRLSLLDKSLDVILDETYEKMLHYAQNLKGPITMLHMLGVVLPILGLVMLPLMVNFMEGVTWHHIATLYNIALPIVVYILGKNILSNRPTGYGDLDISESNPELKKFKNVIFKVGNAEFSLHPVFIAVFVGIVMLFLALSPIILHVLSPNFDISFDKFKFFEYKPSTKTTDIIGPFGLGASILSLFFPLAIGVAAGLYFRLRSKNVIKIREGAKKLEDEFSSALFQLGNRLGDGLPAEVAFERVARVMEDTISGRFFSVVAENISKAGMSVKEAIFNTRSGALVAFPSAIIQSSMKVLIESVKKGPLIAAQALLNVARYIKEIHKVNERLKDLMSDIITDMKSQIAFLTPMIAGIVVGITSMITFILGSLSSQITNLSADLVTGQLSTLQGLFGDGIPTYYFQAVVGIYVVQIVYILTVLSNGIENGADHLQERYLLGNNLLKSTVLYCIIAGLVMLIFNLIASKIIDVAIIVT